MGAQIVPSPNVINGPMTVSGVLTAASDFQANRLLTPSGLVQFANAANGGVETLAKSTGPQANPGANFARLYFRDGTVSGLKLVVIAGAAGAETTILDNIPV